MSNLVELLLRIKPEWEKAYEEYLSEIDSEVRISAPAAGRLLEIMLESHLTGEKKSVRLLLDEWMKDSEDESFEPVSFDRYLEGGLIREIHTLRAILLHTAQENFQDAELQSIHAEVEQFFSHVVEYIAYAEANEHLVRAQKRQREVQDALEQLDSSRANFVSIAAHGLKTPLTLVEGYSKMLAEHLDHEQEEAKPLLEGIESGTVRMRELIDDLVDVAMIDNKMLSLYYQPLRMDELVQGVVDEFADQLKAKRIKLQFDESEGFDQTVYADRDRLEQAFVEVIDNAVKFTPEKGKIRIHGRTLPGFMEVSVADTGIGIAPGDQVRIFDQFAATSEQASLREETYQSLSSGLGLHLCKGILEAHGGAVWVDSPGYDPEECPGSTFHLMIPSISEPPDDPAIRLMGST